MLWSWVTVDWFGVSRLKKLVIDIKIKTKFVKEGTRDRRKKFP